MKALHLELLSVTLRQDNLTYEFYIFFPDQISFNQINFLTQAPNVLLSLVTSHSQLNYLHLVPHWPLGSKYWDLMDFSSLPERITYFGFLNYTNIPKWHFRQGSTTIFWNKSLVSEMQKNRQNLFERSEDILSSTDGWRKQLLTEGQACEKLFWFLAP